MCIDPVSMLVIGTAIQGAGTLVGGVSAKRTADANARALEVQAGLRQEKAKYDIEVADRRFRREEGKALTGIAASGVSSSSFYDILADNAAEAALEKKVIKFGGDADSANLRTQASIQRAQGKSALIGAVFSAAGTFASGYGRAGSMKLGYGSSGSAGVSYEG